VLRELPVADGAEPDARRAGVVFANAHQQTRDGASGASTIRLGSPPPRTADDLPVPPQHKPKRALLPLDLTHTHPGRTNAVPTGLSKVLRQGENRAARHPPRRRLESVSGPNALEHELRPGLDELHVLPILLARHPNSVHVCADLDLDAGLDDGVHLCATASGREPVTTPLNVGASVAQLATEGTSRSSRLMTRIRSRCRGPT
jgi:hypothetical protein